MVILVRALPKVKQCFDIRQALWPPRSSFLIGVVVSVHFRHQPRFIVEDI